MEQSRKKVLVRAIALAWTLAAAPLVAWSTEAAPGRAGKAVLDGPDGPATVRNIAKRYNDTAMDCAGKPAIRCTGVVIEAQFGNEPWQPFADNGVPASWFRRDAPITSTFFSNAGSIYYAADDKQTGKKPQQILCAFTTDAGSDFRYPRCGASDKFPEPSRPCQVQGIATAAQWLAHDARRPVDAALTVWQCGFDIRPEQHDATAAFAQLPELMRVVKSPFGWNEVIIRSWPRDQPGSVPIEAFYYDRADPLAKDRAQALQIGMNDVGGIWRPIIALTFPQTPDGVATFSYFEPDQARPVPPRRALQGAREP